MIQINYPFSQYGQHLAQIASLEQIVTTIPTLSLVDIQNMLVDPDGDLLVQLNSIGDSIVGFQDKSIPNYKYGLSSLVVNLTTLIGEAENETQGRLILTDSLGDMIELLQDYVNEFRSKGTLESISAIASFRSLAELHFAFNINGLGEYIFEIFLQFGFANGFILSGTVHIPIALIDSLQDDGYPSIPGTNMITEGCVEVDISKLITYALENQNFTPVEP